MKPLGKIFEEVADETVKWYISQLNVRTRSTFTGFKSTSQYPADYAYVPFTKWSVHVAGSMKKKKLKLDITLSIDGRHYQD